MWTTFEFRRVAATLPLLIFAVFCFCHKQLIPVLRKWLELAARIKPHEHAAALLLADRVLGRLDSCAEFSSSGVLSADEQEEAQRDYDALEKDLQSLGIRTETPTRIGNEYYAGNLMEKVSKLAPNGPVNELARISILDNRCHWSGDSDSADCDKIIEEGESFLRVSPKTNGRRACISSLRKPTDLWPRIPQTKFRRMGSRVRANGSKKPQSNIARGTQKARTSATVLWCGRKSGAWMRASAHGC